MANKKWERFLLVTGECIVILGLVVSFGRSAVLGLFVGLIVVSVLSLKKELRGYLTENRSSIIMFVSILVLMVGIACLILAPLVASRVGVGGLSRLELRSVQERQGYYAQAIHDVLSRPLLGTGVGVSTLVQFHEDAMRGVFGPSYAYQPVHNIFVLIVVELGVFGGLVFLWWLWRVVRRMNDGVSSVVSYQGYVWCMGGVVVTIILTVVGVFDHFFWTIHGGILMWWLGWGMALALSRRY